MSTRIPADSQAAGARGSAENASPSHPAAPRRVWPRAVAVVAALAAIGVAGYSLKDRMPSTELAVKPAAPAAGGPPAAPELRCRMAVIRVGAGSATDPTTVIARLSRTEWPSTQELINSADPRRLLNEIVRQAVLAAAHDRLGAVTRDAALGEELTTSQPPPEVEVAWLITPLERGSTLSIRQVGAPKTEPYVWKLPKGGSATTPVAQT